MGSTVAFKRVSLKG